MTYFIRILEYPDELAQVEVLQRLVWPGSETEIVPIHMLLATVHNGGIVIGAYHHEQSTTSDELVLDKLVGFVFGFPGQYLTGDGPRLKHHSHMMGIHPDHRSKGLGYLLKRAQWQMIRRQGIDRITWTYDPLLSINAQLNIYKLGAVCNTYHVDYYGVLHDQLNQGLPTDRFQVDWWVNSRRVNTRLSKQARPQLNLSQFMAADANILNPMRFKKGVAAPFSGQMNIPKKKEALLLIEIPYDFQELKIIAPEIAYKWRIQSRDLFQLAFQAGYLITDFVMDNTQSPELIRSFYVLSHGESTL